VLQGAIIDEIMRKSLEGESVDKKQFIYLGDGSGDFCPSLKLRDGDHLLPRKE
jgi:pyridoxal phosphate phosphatase PHOSPHO2